MTAFPAPRPDTWLSPRALVGRSDIDGEGLFARDQILSGELVARFGGRLVSDAGLADLFRAAATSGTYVDTVSVGEAVNLVLPEGDPLHAGNHGCEPTTWWADPYTLVARRDVAAGEELTLDYATITDDPGFVLDCRCGSPRCRGRVTGRDWRLPELQRAYGDHWVPVLRRRIAGTLPR
ncbi:SET domain-containing protein [Isoptericola cucumis]|uniref:SET domain-containing protein n=1 Tax=Isoptericola cucumis TaxID=1776856 RepID=UPI0035315D8C